MTEPLNSCALAATKVDVTLENVRFVSRDSAIEEGFAKVWKGKAEHPVSSRYSVLYAREDGRNQRDVGKMCASLKRIVEYANVTWAKTQPGRINCCAH